MSGPESAVEDAYRALVAEADRLYGTLTERLVAASAGTLVDAHAAAQLNQQLERVTELIDVLQSAVAVVVVAAVQPTS